MTVRQLLGGGHIRWTTGSNGLATLANGAYTVAAIARRFFHTDMAALLSLNVEDTGINMVRWDTSDELGALHSGAESASSGVTWSNADGWALVAVTKAAGTSVIRGHLLRLGSTATRQDSAATIDDNATVCDIAETRWNGDDDWSFRGRLAVMAAWDSALSDVALDGLVAAYSDWVTAAPITLWRFDQPDVDTPVDDQVGDAHQVDVEGTEVIVGDDPPGFSFTEGASAVGYRLDSITGPAFAHTITGPGM